MQTQRDVASFMLRFTQDMWRSATGEPNLQWRGTIRHVQGEEEASFTDFAEAVRFIQRHLTQLTLDALPGSTEKEQDQALRHGLRLWEEFTASYTNMVFEAIEHTLDQSEAFRRRMNQAIRATLGSEAPAPARADADDLSASLSELNARLQELSAKVEKLEQARGSE